MKSLTIREHLNIIRKKAHEVLKRNGHYKNMARLSAISRRKKKK